MVRNISIAARGGGNASLKAAATGYGKPDETKPSLSEVFDRAKRTASQNNDISRYLKGIVMQRLTFGENYLQNRNMFNFGVQRYY